jgi:hypothetical protein
MFTTHGIQPKGANLMLQRKISSDFNTNRRRLQCKILHTGRFSSPQTDHSPTSSDAESQALPALGSRFEIAIDAIAALW